jgi:hypothetical protein
MTDSTSSLELARDHVDRAIDNLDDADVPTPLALLAGGLLVLTRLLLQSALHENDGTA